MIVDVRKYRIKAGCMAAHLEIYEKYGFKAQTRHLGQPLAYLVAETGELNTYIHMWVYESAGDREKKRAAMMADPEWLEYLRRNREAGYLEHQENTQMTPTSFAPIKR